MTLSPAQLKSREILAEVTNSDLRLALESAASGLRDSIRDQYISNAANQRERYQELRDKAAATLEPGQQIGNYCCGFETNKDGSVTNLSVELCYSALGQPRGRFGFPDLSWGYRYQRGALADRYGNPTYGYRLATDAEIAAKAEGWADDAMASFLSKMESKFGRLGQIDSCEFGGHLSHNGIWISYTSGLSFTVRNKIVLKCSHKGTLFNQYPTTFHSVKVNGEPVKNVASEAAVKRLAKSLKGDEEQVKVAEEKK